MRAAFLYQFGNYVEWPAGALGASGSPFVIAVLDGAEVRRELEQITRGREMAGHPVRVLAPDSAAGLGDAAVVYVGASALEELPAVAAAARERPMLVVCAGAERLDEGCMIGFALSAGRLRFDVSLDALAAGRLKVSSRLLAVARAVSGTPR